MSDISGHTRRTKSGKTVKIRPHKRERNKVVDPGERYVEMGDTEIVQQKLAQFLANMKIPPTEFIEALIGKVMKRKIGFLEAEQIFLDYVQKPQLSIEFYAKYAGKEEVEDILTLAEIARVIESEDAVTYFKTKEILRFYNKSKLEQLDSVISASTAKTKINRIKKHLKSITVA